MQKILVFFRDLKTQLMEAEKYKLETEKAQANLNSFKEEVLAIEKEVSLAKEERAQCRMDLGKVSELSVYLCVGGPRNPDSSRVCRST